MTMKQRGSALIISMMMIATVGAAAFGIAKLLYADTTIASTYENGAIAYYAAESGIEEGFLRYKYNMNAEIPYGTTSSPWVLGDNKVFRTNINQNRTLVNTDSVGRDPVIPLDYNYTNVHWVDAAREQIYDLRMGYLGTNGGPFYVQDADLTGKLMDGQFASAVGYGTGDYSFLRIPKDEALKIDLSGLALSTAGNDLDFGLKFFATNPNDFDTSVNQCKAFAEVKLTVQYGGDITKEYKGLMGLRSAEYDTKNCAITTGIDKSKVFLADNYSMPTTGGAEANSVLYLEVNRLQDLITDNGGTLPTTSDKVMFSVKPLNYDAAIALTINKCNNNNLSTDPVDLLGTANDCKDKTNVVAGPYSYITSTGYYGGTSRTLTANIDRQSGTLYDLYDYVLFKGN